MNKNIGAIAAHVAIVLAIIITFGVLGISRSASEGVEKFTGVLEQNVTLRILENDTAKEQGYLKELLDAFNAKYADYGITAVDANMDQHTDLENDGPHGYGPDVLYQANDALMKYTDGRHIQPLPVEKLECFSQVSEEAWQAYTVAGMKSAAGEDLICGVPVNIQGPLLYYRKDLLPENWETAWDKDQNGVPDMVENWTDMYQYSKQVKAAGNGKKFGYMKSLFDTYFSSGYLFSYGAYVFGKDGTDTKDIGFSKGDSVKGAAIIRQLASVMNEGCIDDTITKDAYSKLANGTYFATMTTPDVYTLFIKELTLEYRKGGLTAAQAEEKARENLVMTNVPRLPASGDLEDAESEMIPSKMMGGINGYAISSYTDSPNAALAFVNFATSYEMMERRNALLGIVPARRDLADQLGGLAEVINMNLTEGNIQVMPSVRAIAQVWTPAQTFFSDLAKDPFRKPNEMIYTTLEAMLEGLKKVDKNIYDAIHTLS